MTKRAPDDVRAAPASLLGFASWLSGPGALAWCALDQVPSDKPYTLAKLVAATVASGVHPCEWEAANHPTDGGVDNSADFITRRSAAQSGPARPAPGI